jgi:hypothetical protein
MITQGHARMLTSVLGVSRTITARHDNRYPTLPGPWAGAGTAEPCQWPRCQERAGEALTRGQRLTMGTWLRRRWRCRCAWASDQHTQ